LQISDNGDGSATISGRFSYHLVYRFVFGMIAVAQIEPKDVDAGVDQAPDLVGTRTRRPNGGNDFTSAEV
tara:strand:+ start:1364 stop:1573 length:210 start_codon:yes stop_codon:yes gene_type:complete